MLVQDTETASMQEVKDLTTTQQVGATTTKPKTTFEEMWNAIGDSLSDLASSDNQRDGADKDNDEEDTELTKQSDDDKPGWVMGRISKTVQHRMESVWRKLMRLEELTQPGWRNAANYFHERDMK